MKKSVALLVVILVISGSYVVLGYTGAIQSPFSKPPTYADARELDFTLLSSFVNDEAFSKMIEDAEALDAHIYGVDDSAETVIMWYETENSKNGWEPFRRQSMWTFQSVPGYAIYTRMWNRYLKGQVVIAIEGTYIQRYMGYQTVVITSSAPLSTYDQYFN